MQEIFQSAILGQDQQVVQMHIFTMYFWKVRRCLEQLATITGWPMINSMHIPQISSTPDPEPEEKIAKHAKTYKICADIMASCTFQVEAQSEKQAIDKIQKEEVKRKTKIEWVTSPVVTHIEMIIED